jgi:HAD superfamily hydrolase (TIGR01459 family)
MQHLTRFAPLAACYDGFIIDLWGVIHDGVRAFPGAVNCLQQLKSSGKSTLLLSNAPRPSAAVQLLMRGMGIEDDWYDGLLTSGEAVRRALLEPPDSWWAGLGSRVFHLGPPRDRPLLDGLPLEEVGTPASADFVLNTGPDDARSTWSIGDFETVLGECARARLPMVCANPDLEVIRGGKRILCAGALAARYREMGGDVRSLGKPQPAIYRQCLQQLGIPPSRVLAIGDALETDIAGAAGVALDACWVLDGLHGAGLIGAGGGIDPLRAEQLAVRVGLAPVATITRLVW